MAKVEKERDNSALNAVMPAEALPASTSLYSALIATCEGKALVIVERSGAAEGLEAWRRLVTTYETQTKVTRIAKMLQILSWNFTASNEKDVQEQLERFDSAVAQYEKETEVAIDDDTKTGVVIKGLDAGVLREHPLLTSEEHRSYSAFRENLDRIVRARALAMGTTAPMNIDSVAPSGKGKTGKDGGKGPHWGQQKGTSSEQKGKNKGTNSSVKFEGKCHNCGKPGHKAADCWQKTQPSGQGKGGKGKGKGRGKGKGGRVNELGESTGHEAQSAPSTGGSQNEAQAILSSLSLCSLALDHVAHGDRISQADRGLVWHVDSGACVTVVPENHKAVRGYKTHRDGQSGQTYRTASGEAVRDEGLKYLFGTGGGTCSPMVVRSRVAKVSRPLLSVASLVDNGFEVLFTKNKACAENPDTGRCFDFVRQGSTWTLPMQLDAPEGANQRLNEMVRSVSADGPFNGQGSRL